MAGVGAWTTGCTAIGVSTGAGSGARISASSIEVSVTEPRREQLAAVKTVTATKVEQRNNFFIMAGLEIRKDAIFMPALCHTDPSLSLSKVEN